MAEQIPEPFATGRLDVGDGHVLYHEQVGAREGTPVVYLHGGPGAGCTPGARRSFDLSRHRAVLFDQRAAGRATLAAPSTLHGGFTRRGPAASSSSSMTKVTAGRPWRCTGAAFSLTLHSPARISWL
jgi:pimeloyl-ACP methyl ester carboxylesterase